MQAENPVFIAVWRERSYLSVQKDTKSALDIETVDYLFAKWKNESITANIAWICPSMQ